jgi:signal transduction histidine kinase
LSEQQADLVDRAQRRIKFLQTLIDDLLDLAAGKADVLASAERGLVCLTEVLQEVYTRYAAPAQDKGLALRIEIAPPGDELNVWGDKDELDRILNNLVSNAVKYTPEGEVYLQAGRSDGFVRLVVSDTGIGIPQEAQENLYTEFFRAKNAKQIESTGTGLGLSIVKDLVERYDGQIKVQSAEGQGTTVTLMLPLAQ